MDGSEFTLPNQYRDERERERGVECGRLCERVFRFSIFGETSCVEKIQESGRGLLVSWVFASACAFFVGKRPSTSHSVQRGPAAKSQPSAIAEGFGGFGATPGLVRPFCKKHSKKKLGKRIT